MSGLCISKTIANFGLCPPSQVHVLMNAGRVDEAENQNMCSCQHITQSSPPSTYVCVLFAAVAMLFRFMIGCNCYPGCRASIFFPEIVTGLTAAKKKCDQVS